MTDLERSHAELRAAVRLAAYRLKKLPYRREDRALVVMLRKVYASAKAVASNSVAKRDVG